MCTGSCMLLRRKPGKCPVTGQRGAASRAVTTVGASAATHAAHWASDCALPPVLPRCPPGGDGRRVAAQNTHPPSRAVVLHLTAKCPWAEALPLRPDSAASRTLSPFPAQGRPKCGNGMWPCMGGVSQLRTRTRRLERSRFTSLRSAHGPRPCLCGLIQPPAARYRPSRPKGGLNAATECGPVWGGVRAVSGVCGRA